MIYFIGVNNNEFIKIGYTKNNPITQYNYIQYHNVNKVYFINVVKGLKSFEYLIQQKFKKYKFRNEWYYGNKEIIEFALSLPSISNWNNLVENNLTYKTLLQ